MLLPNWELESNHPRYILVRLIFRAEKDVPCVGTLTARPLCYSTRIRARYCHKAPWKAVYHVLFIVRVLNQQQAKQCWRIAPAQAVPISAPFCQKLEVKHSLSQAYLDKLLQRDSPQFAVHRATGSAPLICGWGRFKCTKYTRVLCRSNCDNWSCANRSLTYVLQVSIAKD